MNTGLDYDLVRLLDGEGGSVYVVDSFQLIADADTGFFRSAIRLYLGSNKSLYSDYLSKVSFLKKTMNLFILFYSSD